MGEADLHPRVGIVIVAYNSAKTIRECVESCLKDAGVSTVVVVDNSRQPETSDVLADILTRESGRLIYSGQPNIGFSRGCNLGARLAGNPAYLAFVNPDVVLEKDVSALVPELTNSEFAIVSGLLRIPGREWQLNARPLPTLTRELCSAVIGADRAYLVRYPKSSSPASPLKVGQVAGAMMLVSSEDFEQLGGFDEQFELYYDDVDICRRSKTLGGAALILSHWGRHIGGVSSSSVSEMSYSVGTVSRIRYFRKARGRVVGDGIAISIGLWEFVMRSVTRRAEGQRARDNAMRAQLRELISPGSVRVLR